MGAAPKIIDKKTLQTLVPFNALSPMHFNEVAQKTVVEEVRAGRLVFKEGDRDNQSVYLLEGEINLVAGNEIVGAIAAGSDASRHPIAQQQPRQVSARAKSNVVVARIDSSLLDIMLTWDQSSGYEVAEISDDDDDDWMTRILQSQAFLKLPPSNIQRLLMKVESIAVSAGEVIIRQGGDGDYFYIIKNGRCMVTRKPSANAKEVKLAELADGDAFGEDALVSDAKRNATITMMTDGVLMRLAKKDFVELLKEPLLNKLNYQEAAAKVAKGAVWLDVRLPGEYENVHVPGSRNIPLSALRLEANGLDHAVKYIVCCDTGRRSASAAFVLSQRGFDVYILNEGLASVPAEALEGNAVTVPAAPANPEPAAVVELKPQSVGSAAAARPAVTDSAELAALQGRIEALQQEKQALESAQQQLGGRVGELQEELERVRDESREQILELEQILDTARKDTAAARAELLAFQETLNNQRQADSAAQEQIDALEAELAERRSHEERLRAELKALQGRAAELEAVHQTDVKQWAETDSERTRLLARIEELQPLLEQVEAQRVQIAGLEAALQNASQQGDRTQAEQAQRLSELEAALQVATAALERAHQEAAARSAELEAARDQALAQAQGDAAQQLEDMQARLEQAATLHAELESRLNTAQVQEQAAVTELQTLREALSTLQAQVETGSGELEAQRTRAEQAIGELAQLREAQITALEGARQESEHLQAELEAQRAALGALQVERDALSGAAAESAQAQTELRLRLDEAHARIEALSADAGEQVRQLQAALEAAQREAQCAVDERASVAVELAGAQARLTELDEELTRRSESVQAIEQRLHSADAALAAAHGEQATLQEAHAEAQRELQALEARLADAQREAAQARDAHQAELAALQAQLAARDDGQKAAEERIRALEARLADAQAEADRREQEQQSALTSLQAEHAAAERAREELARQLADAASGQDEQLQQLTQLREDLHTAQTGLQEADAARDEIEGRLAEMSAAAAEAQSALQQMEQAHAQALAEAEQRSRSALEAQLADLRSELEGARAALAREQAQRSNLQQATQAEFDAARADLVARLDAAEQALTERQQALAEADATRDALEAQLAEARSAAADQQQALFTELEQLREVTTADLAAMQRQMEQLQDELKAARRLSAGGSANEEIERLRLLLDEAREEAGNARADADQWREQAGTAASAASDDSRLNDELAAMRIQLEDLQGRVREALSARDNAQQEAAQLRQALQERPQAAVVPPLQQTEARPAGRGSLWIGLAAGLLLGGIGAGAALWLGQSAQAPAQPSVVAAPVATPRAAVAVAEVQPVIAQPKPVPGAVKAGEPAEVPAEKGKPHAGRTFHDSLSDGSRGPQMVDIAAAEFQMGSSANSLDFDERPRHQVKLRRFAIGKTEVTFDEYDTFARATGRRLPDDKGWGRGRRPVINVSWEDAVAYTHWLSEQTGARYRLPSEAEWEYAAGGFERTLYWWGNTPGEGRANCFNCASQWDAKTSAPAASFMANPLGLHDTAGNVSEWVQDCYHPGYEGAPADGGAWMDVGCARRVVRGGGFNSPANTLRTAKRDQHPANMRADDLGFRVAREF